MGRYRTGNVIWASITGHDGTTKRRTVMIASRDEDCDRGDDLLVIAISSDKPGHVHPPYHVLVHNSHDRDPVTGLYRPCYAKCNFYEYVPQSKAERVLGTIPDYLLETILETFDELQSDPDFEDWN